ncbi:MAG: hypothetical protein NT131_05945 [Methanomassiliicoccales archaeon]|nr:hypothetical protein [Methanomassiliicoccales archaeon]
MTEYLTFEYPQNTGYREKWKILSLFIALFGIPVALVYQSLFPLVIFFVMALLSYLGLWYGQDYSVPKKVGIGDHGVDLLYVNGRKTVIPWAQLNSYGLSSSPETTIAPAIIFYSGRKFNYVSYSAAVEIAKRYELFMNKPLREVWLAKDLKNRFRNL